MDSIKNIRLEDITVFDIETAGEYQDPNNLPTQTIDQFWKRHKGKNTDRQKWEDEKLEDSWWAKCGVDPLFGKVLCVSFAQYKDSTHKEMKTTTISSHNEKEVLEKVSKVVEAVGKRGGVLGGHNIKIFDLPFLAWRMMVNKVKVPKLLDIFGKKAWSLKNHLDTLEIWQGAGYTKPSLSALCYLLNIPTPKNDIDGSMVGKVYWNNDNVDLDGKVWEDGLERVAVYCEKDVIANLDVFKKMYENQKL